MTDARFPERWLNDHRFQEISGEDFRAYAFALMSSVANRTDGIVAAHRLRFIPGMTVDVPARLVAAGLWVQMSDGDFLIDGFAVTQTTRKELEALDRTRAKEAEAKRMQRLQARQEAADREETAGQHGVGTAVRPDVRQIGPLTAGFAQDEAHYPRQIAAGQPGVGTDIGADVGADVRPDAPRTGQRQRRREEVLPAPESEFHERTDERVCSAPGCLSSFGLLGVSANDARLFCRRHHPALAS